MLFIREWTHHLLQITAFVHLAGVTVKLPIICPRLIETNWNVPSRVECFRILKLHLRDRRVNCRAVACSMKKIRHLWPDHWWGWLLTRNRVLLPRSQKTKVHRDQFLQLTVQLPFTMYTEKQWVASSVLSRYGFICLDALETREAAYAPIKWFCGNLDLLICGKYDDDVWWQWWWW